MSEATKETTRPCRSETSVSMRHVNREEDIKLMTVRRIAKNEIPAGRRGPQQPEQRFGQDWLDLLAIFSGGLNPYQAVEIKLTNTNLKQPSLSYKKAVQQHIKRLGLSYDVTVRGKDSVYVSSR